MAILEDYGYKPQIHKFFSEDENEKKSFTFGFELETECDYDSDNDEVVCNDLTDCCKNIFGEDFTEKELLYFKYDGSLDNGIEIVSQPMSYKYFLRNFEKFQNFFEKATEIGLDSHENGRCGLHFHIGDNVFENHFGQGNENTQLEYCAVNMDRIINHFKSELITVSRRRYRDLNWCQFSGDGKEESSKNYVKNTLKKGHCNDRYHALNTTNDNTLEVRLFRGTLNDKTFFVTFNLINNLANFAMSDGKILTWDELFFTGLDDDMKEYAKEYFNEQKVFVPNRGFGEMEYTNKPLRTSLAPELEKQVCQMKLKDLGLI